LLTQVNALMAKPGVSLTAEAILPKATNSKYRYIARDFTAGHSHEAFGKWENVVSCRA
jgi:hypothetical protein